jgi:hypothetical protein
MSSDELFRKKIGEGFACVGEWWIPNTLDSGSSPLRCCGTLTFSLGEGIKLTIVGQLKKTPLEHIEMVWGVSEEGECITLFQCLRVGDTMGAIRTESYLAGAVFVSKETWLIPCEEITFKSLTLQYTHLGEWVGVSGLKGSRIEEFVKKGKVGITFEVPEQLPSIRVKSYIISLHFEASWPAVGAMTRKATIEQHTSISIEPRNSTDIPLREVYTLVRGIQNFLSLLTYDDPIYPLIIEGTTRIGVKTADDKSAATMRLLYDRVGTKKPSQDLSKHKMLFTYNDFAGILESALNKMIVVEDDQLKPVFDEFFADYFNPAAYPQDRFMATVRAIEAFHRRTSEKDYYMEKEKYLDTCFKTFLEPVDKATSEGRISSDFRNRLKSQLYYGYEYSLRKRLGGLFTLYGEEFLTLFVDEEKSAFVNKVVDTRNWLTHFDEQKKAVREGKELAYLNLKLQLFMIALLLRYIGIPQKDIEDQFKHWKFDYLKPVQTQRIL